MTGVIVADVGEAQGKPLDQSYPHRIVSVRCAFASDYTDHLWAPNREAIKREHGEGRIEGAIVYGVQIFSRGTPAQHAERWHQLIGTGAGGHAPDWLIWIMNDLETWNGDEWEQHGDHSGDVDELNAANVAFMGGHERSAGWYGNHGDLAELAPHRSAHPGVVASFGSQLTFHDVPHAIAQQYTNGQIAGPPGLPLSSAPWGRCDHNVFPGFTDAAALRAFLRPSRKDQQVTPAEVQAAVEKATTPLQQTLARHHERLHNHRERLDSAEKRLHALDHESAPHPQPGKGPNA